MEAQCVSLQTTARALAECCICLDFLREPRALGCQHALCTPCLRDLLLDSADKKLTCPTCRAVTSLTSDDVTELPLVFYLNTLAEAARLSEGQAIPCSPCSHDGSQARASVPEAAYRCADCQGDWLCEECAGYHRRLMLTRNHRLTPVAEARNQADSSSQLRESDCCLHQGLELKFYCIDCDKPICTDCKVLDCNSHKAALLADHMRRRDENLRALLQPLENRVKSCELHLRRLSSERSESTDEINSYLQKWEANKVKLLELINKRDTEIKKAAEKQKTKITEEYQKMKEVVSARLNEARKERDLENTVYSYGNNVERFEQLQKLSARPPARDQALHLTPPNFLLNADVTWIDLLLVPPQHAGLLPGSQAALVDAGWARRTSAAVREHNCTADPIELVLDDSTRADYYLIDRSLADLLRWQPYPTSMDVNSCSFPPGINFFSKSRFPLALPVQFAYIQQTTKSSSGTKFYALLGDMDESLESALKASGLQNKILRASTRNGDVIDPCHSFCQLMNMGLKPLKEFDVLIIQIEE